VGTDDRRKLDEYLDSVRDIDAGFAAPKSEHLSGPAPPGAPERCSERLRGYARLMAIHGRRGSRT
jgi:hypothetical protein